MCYVFYFMCQVSLVQSQVHYANKLTKSSLNYKHTVLLQHTSYEIMLRFIELEILHDSYSNKNHTSKISHTQRSSFKADHYQYLTTCVCPGLIYDFFLRRFRRDKITSYN